MKNLNTALFISILTAFIFSGCFHKNKEPDQAAGIQVLPVAIDDGKMGIVVSYVDSANFSGRPMSRIKVVTPQEFDSTVGYKFLGRAYSKDHPGLNGFGVAVYEYWTNLYSRYHTSDGFKYSFGIQCSQFAPDVACPAPGNDIKSDPVLYSYSLENLPAGIVTLFQYETPGGTASGVTGIRAVAFTTDVQEIIGMQLIYGNIPVKRIGFIFHSTQEDRDKRLK